MENNYIGCVLYTDGSARPNPGFGGSGVHGYIYTTIKPKEKIPSPDKHIITNIGYINKDDIKSINRYFVEVYPLEFFDIVTSYDNTVTNNYCELMGVIKGLEEIKNKIELIDNKFYIYKNTEYNNLQEPISKNQQVLFIAKVLSSIEKVQVNINSEHIKNLTINNIEVLIDSEYVRKGIIDWSKDWIKNNWISSTGTLVANKDIWQLLLDLIKELESKNIKMNFTHVDGHSDILGNEIADKLSIIGMNRSSKRKISTNNNKYLPNNYWKNDIDKHPFLNHKRLYYNSLVENNTLGTYYIADPGDVVDTVMGKRVPDASFSVIKLEKPDSILEMIRNAHNYLNNGINIILYARLDRIYSKYIYPYLSTYQTDALLKDNRNLFGFNFIQNLSNKNSTKEDSLITIDINPPNLSLMSVEIFNHLEKILDSFISKITCEHFKFIDSNKKEKNKTFNKIYNIVDITDFLFINEEKKSKNKLIPTKKLNPKLDNNDIIYYNLVIELNNEENNTIIEKEVKIPLIWGMDIIHRNNIKRLIDTDFNVYLLYYFESPNNIRYCTIIKSNNDYGIWSNVFSNNVLLDFNSNTINKNDK